jgi:hypothetical protein
MSNQALLGINRNQLIGTLNGKDRINHRYHRARRFILD